MKPHSFRLRFVVPKTAPLVFDWPVMIRLSPPSSHVLPLQNLTDGSHAPDGSMRLRWTASSTLLKGATPPDLQ
jgi:hypothetical protein